MGAIYGDVRTISAVGLFKRLACATSRATSAACCGGGPPSADPAARRAAGPLSARAMMWPSWPDALRPSSAAVSRDAPGRRNLGSCYHNCSP